MHRKYGNIHALDSHLNNYGGDMDGSIKNATHKWQKRGCRQIMTTKIYERREQRNDYVRSQSEATDESKMHTIPGLITLRSTTFNFPSYNWLHNDNQYSFRQS